MKGISKLKDLYFLDISYAKLVTDEGLANFSNKQLPIEHLCVNGVDKISSTGLGNIVSCCSETLVELEAAMLMQQSMKSDCFEQIGKCYELEYLDFSGGMHIDDMFFMQMSKNKVKDPENPGNEANMPWPGLPNLHTLKIGKTGIMAHNLGKFLAMTGGI
jgi:hypothetical protein